MLAIKIACEAWRPYLHGPKFEIRTDHASLEGILKQKHLQGRMARWVEYLSIFDFDIVYRRGKTNFVADALSRVTLG